MKKIWIIHLCTLLALVVLKAEDNVPTEVSETDSIEIVLSSEVKWTFLNPKRGALAPMAGTLWGDRNSTGPTGFLLKPSDGFESPPHTHNVSYRGVVIEGGIHNDDPDAGEMWMPTGSFWTQPKGHVHITAAEGSNTLAYIEIEEGPYLVLPPEEAFDSGERPINVHESNVFWLGASDVTWVNSAGNQVTDDSPAVAFLWGSTKPGELNGTFIRVPSGFRGQIHSSGTTFRAVVIKGQLEYAESDGDISSLEPGSYISSSKETVHPILSVSDKETILYVRTNGKYEIVSK